MEVANRKNQAGERDAKRNKKTGDKKKGEKVRDSIGWLLNYLMEHFLLSVSPK